MAELFTPEEREQIGFTLNRWIRESENAKGNLPKRWERNEAIYRLQDEACNLNVVKGMKPYALPLWRQRCDKMCADVYGSITGLYPYCQYIPESEDGGNAENVESAAMKLAAASDFDAAFRKALRVAANTGIGCIRVRCVERAGGVSPECVSIHPKDLVISPTWSDDPAKWLMIGARFYRPLWQIHDLQKDGTYFDDFEVLQSSQPSQHEASLGERLDSYTQSGVLDERPVELFEVEFYWMVKENRLRFRATLAFLDMKVLSIAPVEEKDWSYVLLRFTTEDGGVWPQDCPAQGVQAINVLYNDVSTYLAQGSLMDAWRPVFIIGGQMMGQVKEYNPGDIIFLPAGASIASLPGSFNPAFMPSLLEKLEEMADSATTVGRLGTSQALPAGATATEAAALEAAQQAGKDAFIDAISPSIRKVFEKFLEMLRDYGDKLGKSLGFEVDPNELAQPMRAEPTGKSALSNPETRMRKLQILNQLALQPGSKYDPAKVEDKIVQSLDLGFDARTLEKDDLSQATAALAALTERTGVPATQFVTEGFKAIAPQIPNGLQPGNDPSASAQPGMAMDQSHLPGAAA